MRLSQQEYFDGTSLVTEYQRFVVQEEKVAQLVRAVRVVLNE